MLAIAVFSAFGVMSLSSASLNYFEINKQLDIFANLFREVSMNYVDDTEPGFLRAGIDTENERHAVNLCGFATPGQNTDACVTTIIMYTPGG